MYTTASTISSSMLTIHPKQIGTLGRAINPKSQIASHLLDVITTTLSPIVSTSFDIPDEDVTLPTIGYSQAQNLVDSRPLELFHDLFRHMGTSTDAAALLNALVASFSVILVSELGDKTFIITAIMAMKNSRLLVFLSSAFALLLMTILSVGMGVAVTVIPKQYTHYASILLFLYFGFRMLKEAYDMNSENEPDSEFDEVKKSIESEQEGVAEDKQLNEKDESTVGPPANAKHDTVTKTLYIAPIVIKVFTMILVAEWGDRSQISTVILAAREDVVGVFIGSLSGHILCTGLAVLGGRFVAEIISVRTMTLLGGLIFLFFAIFAVFTGAE